MYSVLTKKIGEYGYNTIQATRRVFLYGLFMIPALFILPLGALLTMAGLFLSELKIKTKVKLLDIDIDIDITS